MALFKPSVLLIALLWSARNNVRVFLYKLTFVRFSCFNVPFFSPAWTYHQIAFASPLFSAPVSFFVYDLIPDFLLFIPL